MPELFSQFLTLITTPIPQQRQFSKFILMLRYHQKYELSNFLSFSILLLKCNNLNTHKPVYYNHIQEIYKRLLFQADYLFILIIYCKLLTLLNWVQTKSQREINDIIGFPFRQFTKSIKSKQAINQQAIQCFQSYLAILRLLEKQNFFTFYFQLMNGAAQSLQANIEFYFLQFEGYINSEDCIISSSQIGIIKKNVYLQYAKIGKRKFQEQAISSIYKWLQMQIQFMYYEGDSSYHYLIIQTLLQGFYSKSIYYGATLLQILDTSLENINKNKFKYILQIVDNCLIEGNYKISTQAIIFLISTIFNKIHNKKIEINFQFLNQHFILWKQISIKRKLPYKLLTCLIQWMPFLYNKEIKKNKEQIQILQLYRNQLLKIQNQSQIIEISGLKMVIEELQFRKIDAIYKQMQEFHEEMNRSHSQILFNHKPQKSSSRINFEYKTSKISKSNSQINSLLNALQSQISKDNHKSKNVQLQILSKPHSLSGGFSANSQRSAGQCVQIIMSLIQLFNYHVKEGSQMTIVEPTISGNNSGSINQYQTIQNVLPVISTLPDQPSIKSSNFSTQKTVIKQININYYPQPQEAKMKMVKSRGIISKTKFIEIGYLISNIQNKISFFITFLKPYKYFMLKFKQNSFKIKNQKSIKITEPKFSQHLLNYIHKAIKIYKDLEGEYSGGQNQQIYQMPINFFNLIQWLPIQQKQLINFENQPTFETKWLPACPKFIKQGEQYLSKFFIFKRDKNGSYLMKGKLLENIQFVKIIIILTQMKIQIVVGDSVALAIGILDVIG